MLYGSLKFMAELNSAGTGVRVKIEIWVDNGKIVFSNVDQDCGPKGADRQLLPPLLPVRAPLRVAPPIGTRRKRAS